MRTDLFALRAAGLMRVRFSAHIQKINHRGFIVLENVYGPTGMTQHIWVKPDQWHGHQPHPGQPVEFMATIEPYWKGAGVEDLCLVDLEVLR